MVGWDWASSPHVNHLQWDTPKLSQMEILAQKTDPNGIPQIDKLVFLSGQIPVRLSVCPGLAHCFFRSCAPFPSLSSRVRGGPQEPLAAPADEQQPRSPSARAATAYLGHGSVPASPETAPHASTVSAASSSAPDRCSARLAEGAGRPPCWPPLLEPRRQPASPRRAARLPLVPPSRASSGPSSGSTTQHRAALVTHGRGIPNGSGFFLAALIDSWNLECCRVDSSSLNIWACAMFMLNRI
ncbi:hypothetical protein BRADI_1g14497v3 [Brachypodium distachyon]|uniref:Uncharacterized protein n=1 Tax=Brachypodium distachyon TaxID=15368 RepID=A0A2K2DJG7_BRADI|nr:hypothetical protein BRADI_1g14497v3 [Brachypodium distachyon]